MSDETSPVRVSLAIDAPNDGALLAWAIKHAEENGYSVRPPNEDWESGSAYCQRLKIHSQTLKRASRHPDRPIAIIICGASGRIIQLLSNPDFDAFVLRYKSRPKSTWKRPSRKKPEVALIRRRMNGRVRSYV